MHAVFQVSFEGIARGPGERQFPPGFAFSESLRRYHVPALVREGASELTEIGKRPSILLLGLRPENRLLGRRIQHHALPVAAPTRQTPRQCDRCQ